MEGKQVAGGEGAVRGSVRSDRLARLADLPFWLVSLVSLLNGALFSRAFAPVDFFPAAFVSFPLLLLCVWHSRSVGQALHRGWWFGFGFFLSGLVWTGYSFTQQGPNASVPLWLAPIAVFGLSAAMALYIALACACARWLSGGLSGGQLKNSPFRAGRPLAVVLFAALWTLFEIARGMFFTGFPWHIASSLWANWLPVLQSSYYVGVYGLSFITVVLASLPAAALSGQFTPFSGWAEKYLATGIFYYRCFFWCMISVLVFGAVAGLGYVRLEQNPTLFHLNTSIRLVQAAIPQQELWIRSRWGDHFDTHTRLSRGLGKGAPRDGNSAGKAAGIKLLIWPESGIQNADLDRQDSLNRWRLSGLLERGAYALVGAPRYERTAEGLKFYNSMMAVNSQRDVVGVYDKQHLVPFGEYMPFAGLFERLGLQHLTGGSAYTKGKQDKKPVYLPGVPSFSTLICYEVVFPGQAFDPSLRPEWLLTLTNDGWFGRTEGPYQHLALARMRAVEEGLPLVRNAISGISAVFDPFGRQITYIPLGESAIRDSILPQAYQAPLLSGLEKIALFVSFMGIISFFAIIARVKEKN